MKIVNIKKEVKGDGYNIRNVFFKWVKVGYAKSSKVLYLRFIIKRLYVTFGLSISLEDLFWSQSKTSAHNEVVYLGFSKIVSENEYLITLLNLRVGFKIK